MDEGSEGGDDGIQRGEDLGYLDRKAKRERFERRREARPPIKREPASPWPAAKPGGAPVPPPYANEPGGAFGAPGAHQPPPDASWQSTWGWNRQRPPQQPPHHLPPSPSAAAAPPFWYSGPNSPPPPGAWPTTPPGGWPHPMAPPRKARSKANPVALVLVYVVFFVLFMGGRVASASAIPGLLFILGFFGIATALSKANRRD